MLKYQLTFRHTFTILVWNYFSSFLSPWTRFSQQLFQHQAWLCKLTWRNDIARILRIKFHTSINMHTYTQYCTQINTRKRKGANTIVHEMNESLMNLYLGNKENYMYQLPLPTMHTRFFASGIFSRFFNLFSQDSRQTAD